MRIIGGTAKRRTIHAPKGMDTRPTQDYIREALFNILQGYVDESVCLDLFAGSGALGLEAISRGSKYCVFCDKSRAAYTQIKENISLLGFDEQSMVLKCDWQLAIANSISKNIKFDLVFIDPPYKIGNIEDILTQLSQGEALNKSAIIVLERDKKSDTVTHKDFNHISHKEYGITTLDIYEFEVKDE